MQLFKNKEVLIKREVILLYLARYGIKEIFERNAWEGLMGPFKPIVVELVKEFYSRIPHIIDISSCNQFYMTLRRILFTLLKSLIAYTLRLSQVLNSKYPF